MIYMQLYLCAGSDSQDVMVRQLGQQILASEFNSECLIYFLVHCYRWGLFFKIAY